MPASQRMVAGDAATNLAGAPVKNFYYYSRWISELVPHLSVHFLIAAQSLLVTAQVDYYELAVRIHESRSLHLSSAVGMPVAQI